MKRAISLGAVALFAAPLFASAATCPSLSLGSTGPSVSALQKILYDAYEGYPAPTGYFGSITQAALKQWQSEHGLESVGFVGPKTAAAMNLCTASNVAAQTISTSANTSTASPLSAITRALSRGLSGSDVFALQQFLVAQKLLSPDSATGYFGVLTEAAVQRFQSQRGIVSSGSAATTGYGAVGPKTRALINSLLNTSSSLVSSTGTDSATLPLGASTGSGTTSGGEGTSPTIGVASGGQSIVPNPNPAPPGTPLCTVDAARVGQCALQ